MSAAADAARALIANRPRAVALCCDFDGSLAEIVADPSAAAPVPGALDALHELARELGVVAVVSGRPGRFLAERLELASRRSGLRAYGLYGAEEVGSDGTVVPALPAASTVGLSALAEAARAALPEALVEEKGTSLALHFRTAPATASSVRTFAADAAARAGLELRAGRMVVELVVPAAPDKGVVVRRLGADCAACCAIGDDLGDLAAFDALDALEAHGNSVLRVAVASSEGPDELIARADLVLGGPHETVTFLRTLSASAKAT